MTLLNRYILSTYGRIFLLALAAFVGIYLLVDFFEKVDNFISHQARPSLYLLYFSNKIPLIVAQVTPLAVLMGVFLTLGGFSSSNELTAMRAGGLSLVRISAPLLGAALLTTLAVMAVNEYVVPLSVKKTNHILRTEVKGKSDLALTKDRVWFREGQAIINVRQALPASQALQGVSIFDLDENFRLKKRVSAASAIFQNGTWTLENVTERRFEPGNGGQHGLDKLPSRPLVLSKTPEDFQVTTEKNEELGFRQLRELAGRLKAEGYDNTRYLVDMHSRLATPFACLIMAFLGIPFALQKGRGASLAMGVTISVAIGIAYFILQATLLAFGYSNILPPLIAAWSANLLFALLGFWLLLRTRS
ncbi:LPS export ABC transporter permease LptG [Desulfuromonas versatilis]|uniref:LPS export ABC transporter permease LptG n=1 Tax=Desulfuromonas versatilis TaxID=2802975 RepID=A0ABN6DZJ5_9BACT|nr:LPS export ABC transporter permease LptG [Desulfuromonas versatilis]BCR05470.1 LPS export ABC transporter permease LptG [Desulfuromonas versatilis]